MNHAQEKHKKRFVLTMRNQKGQVGIFVALIFQVIFVFFAMLVNVGLVVHHKINLQQSTDLAAYYGAMKQAEIMNVMAHVNYQIRQAWKLFTWRYRVLGTFGVEQDKPGTLNQIEFPVQWGAARLPKYNQQSRAFACSTSLPRAGGITITDIPFMCMGHSGFADWISAQNQRETFCKIDCNTFNAVDGSAFSITKIPDVGTQGIYGNTMGASVNAAIQKANTIIQKTCNALGPYSTQMLALFYGNYIKDTGNRREFIYMLAKNLGLPEDQMLDIEGNLVFDGVKNTLRNNLTEANLTSMNPNSITALNGVKSFNGGTSFAEGMLRQITFERLMFFLMDCKFDGSTFDTKIKSLYAPGSGDLDTNVGNQLGNIMDAAGVDGIRNLFKMNTDKFNTVGFEKNPWVQVYFGVKATAEPKIPFLPLAKIKLHAISFAKPFGGSIGPWYYKYWPNGADKSEGAAGSRTDINLPLREISSPPATFKEAREFFPNYSTYVGDNFSNKSATADQSNKAGLANTDIVAFYHNLLANKYGKADSEFSSDKTAETTKQNTFNKPDNWPKYAEWYHLVNDVNDPLYDALAVDRQGGVVRNTYMRDIELSVVAPNQFDVTYYSIEPDFHSNYVTKLTTATVQKIAGATGTPSPVPTTPLDFGNRKAAMFAGGTPVTFFNVRQQLEVTHKLFKEAYTDIVGINGNSDPAMRFGLDVIASRQASVLTGWTFLNLTMDGYKNFPAPGKSGKYSMLFGTCDKVLNPWSDIYRAPYSDKADLPPVPGNCVSGGRTGYSVKLISSDILRSTRKFENLGGPGQDGEIKNPVPETFLQF